MPYRSILLDADNTLFDFDRSEGYALQHALEGVGVVFEERHRRSYHRINRACWRAYEAGTMTKEKLRIYRFEQLFAGIEVSDSDPVHFADEYMRHLAATDHLIEGARELLDRLYGRFRLVMVTNGLTEVQRPRLTNTGLHDYFEAIVVSDEIGFSKPDARFFDHAFEQMGHPEKESVLMVGDNLNADIRGAQDYGLDTCWYNPGRQVGRSEVRPTFEIRELAELIGHLQLPATDF